MTHRALAFHMNVSRGKEVNANPKLRREALREPDGRDALALMVFIKSTGDRRALEAIRDDREVHESNRLLARQALRIMDEEASQDRRAERIGLPARAGTSGAPIVEAIAIA